MSLINDMLKDLETRRSSDKKEEAQVLSGLQASNVLPKNNLRFVIIALVIAIVVVLALGLFIKPKTAHKNDLPNIMKAQTIQHAPASTDTAINKAQQASQAASKSKAAKANNSPTPVNTNASVPTSPVLLGVQPKQISANAANLNLEMSNKVHYQITKSNNGQQVKLTLQGIHLVGEVANIRQNFHDFFTYTITQKQNSSIQLNMLLSDGVQLSHVGFDNNHPPKLSIQVTTPSQQAGAMLKQEVPLTAHQQAEKAYQKAIEQLQSGEAPAAINQLKLIIGRTPDFEPARLSLVSFYLNHKKNKLALNLINQGLSLNPSSANLNLLKAQWLVSKNKLSKAIELLQALAPPLNKHQDYYAYLAGLYQQNNQQNLAAGLYSQLLQLKPGNSLWWLGYGVALESQGHEITATEAYKRALLGGGLNPQLQAFVHAKLQQLQG